MISDEALDAAAEAIYDHDLGYMVSMTEAEQFARVALDAVKILAEKSRTLGYIVLSKRTNRMDWDDEIYVTTEAAIDSLCGPYQDYTRDPADETYWGKDYRLCPVIEPEATR